jgi:hypothetical protein
MSAKPRHAFIDAEYTGEHARTTLVSLAVVGEDGESVELVFDDFDRDQVTPWLEENVLAHLDMAKAVSRHEGWTRLVAWFEDYRRGRPVSLVSVGKTHDLVLLFELWHFACPERKYFHNLHCLPDWLNHAAHYDLPTVFFMRGLDPGLDRAAFLGAEAPAGRRHDALYDARVARACFMKCLAMPGGR